MRAYLSSGRKRHARREKVLEQAHRALAGERVEPLEHRIIHRDGTTRWIRNTIVVTRDDAGTPVAYDGLINDITQMKRSAGHDI